MAKYEKTGLIDHVVRYRGQYADVANTVDYQEAIQIINDADTMFSSLPAKIRDKFANSPADFLAFVHDPDVV